MANVILTLDSLYSELCETMLADELAELRNTLAGIDRHEARRGRPRLTFSIVKLGNIQIKMGGDKTHQGHISMSIMVTTVLPSMR